MYKKDVLCHLFLQFILVWKMKFIILLCVVLLAVHSQQEHCDEIQDIVVSELSPLKTFIDDESKQCEKKINSKLFDAVSALVTCNSSLSSFLHSFLATNNVKSLKDLTSAFDDTVVSTYDKIRTNYTQEMVAKKAIAMDATLYKTIQDAINMKTGEMRKLIAVKNVNETCFIKVFKKAFKILTGKLLTNVGDFLIKMKDDKISDKWEKYVITLNKWCDDITTEVKHCKDTTFMTCCIDAYVSKVTHKFN